MSVKILEVNQDNNGRRLDNYLISIFKNIPKSKIYNIIRKGRVKPTVVGNMDKKSEE